MTALLPKITTALRWKSRRSHAPAGAIGGAAGSRDQYRIHIHGLLALGVPTRTLRGMPDEFIDGMMDRAPMLGDDFRRHDPVKTGTRCGPRRNYRLANPNIVHILITLNAQMNPDGSAVEALEPRPNISKTLCRQDRRSEHSRRAQSAGGKSQPSIRNFPPSFALPDGSLVPTPKEHFGFTDGIGDPVFDGQYPGRHEQTMAEGNGAVDGTGNWRPLATGEFLLGYPDEAQEMPGSAMPLDFSRNGTFMAYRKLHQNVVAFRTFHEVRPRSGSAPFSA